MFLTVHTSNNTVFFSLNLMFTGSNPIYNLLSDILGKLSSQNLKEESFCSIMQFLIASIKKVSWIWLASLVSSIEKLIGMFFCIFRTSKWKLLSRSFAIDFVELLVWNLKIVLIYFREEFVWYDQLLEEAKRENILGTFSLQRYLFPKFTLC